MSRRSPRHVPEMLHPRYLEGLGNLETAAPSLAWRLSDLIAVLLHRCAHGYDRAGALKGPFIAFASRLTTKTDDLLEHASAQEPTIGSIRANIGLPPPSSCSPAVA